MTNKQATLFPIIGCMLWILIRLWSIYTLFTIHFDFIDFQNIVTEIVYLTIPFFFIIFFITLYKSLK